MYNQEMNLKNLITKSYMNVDHGGEPEELSQKINLLPTPSDKWMGRWKGWCWDVQFYLGLKRNNGGKKRRNHPSYIFGEEEDFERQIQKKRSS